MQEKLGLTHFYHRKRQRSCPPPQSTSWTSIICRCSLTAWSPVMKWTRLHNGFWITARMLRRLRRTSWMRPDTSFPTMRHSRRRHSPPKKIPRVSPLSQNRIQRIRSVLHTAGNRSANSSGQRHSFIGILSAKQRKRGSAMWQKTWKPMTHSIITAMYT